jgi:hypothetical protein
MITVATGALAGWKHRETPSGLVLTLQIAADAEAFQQRRFKVVQVALNDRQLRSLTRDLARMTMRRGMDLFARPSLWGRLTGRAPGA